MTLKDRLLSAREDYRTLALDTADAVAEPRRHRRGRRALAAAAVVAAVAGGLGWWSMSDDNTEVEAGPAPASTALTRNDPEPPGAVAAHADEIVLTPPGPYADGQVITVSVPEDFAADLLNGSPQGARQCAVLADGPEGPGEWCDPVERSVSATATASSVDVRVSRVVFTPTGHRDCGEPSVTCRIVLAAVGGSDVASSVLRFDEIADPAPATIELTATDTPGVVTLRAAGLSPHPSWLELRATDPERAAGFGPFGVSVCAFAEPEEPRDPWGANPWGPTAWSAASGASVQPPNCDQFGEIATPDPDDPSASRPATVPTRFLGYGGWSDCRTDHCFVQVRQTVVHGFEPGGGLLGSDEVVAMAMVRPDLVDPEVTLPTLRILTPGPHAPGQDLTVEVTGLSDGRSSSIGVCQIESPWGCGYLGGVAGPDPIGNGTRIVRLPEQFACPTRCYLELDSQGEGMPPLATAALDLG
jgi:hypothetical protein